MFKSKITKSFFLLIVCLSVAPSLHSQVLKDPHNEGLISSLNLGFRFSSVLQNRGVILYRDFQIDPVIAVFFLDDRVEFLGDSIGYRDFLFKDWLRLRTRLVSLSDNALFPDNESISNSSPDRPNTYEWTTTVEFFVPGYNDDYFAEVDFSYSKDLKETYGNYLELQTKMKLFDFREPLGNTLIEPNLFASVGWGDAAHNEYFYGPDVDKNGFNNLAYGLWFAFPEESDRFYPIIQIRRFQTIGDFKDGVLAKGRDEGWMLSFIATYGFLDD